ncbi:MAG: peptidase C39, partial [Pseudomonadota bacterium]
MVRLRFVSAGLLPLAAALMLGLAAPAQASEAQSSEARFEVNGTRLSVPIKTWKDLRDQNVVRQQLDYSCGAAAMATLMTYGIGRPTSEAEVIAAMITDLVENERETREKEGFSLLDMKRYAESIGLQAQGFR